MSTTSEKSNLPEGPEEPPRRPWIKIVVIVVALAVLVMVAGMLLGGGEHGPWRHALGDPGDDGGAVTGTARAIEVSL